jgi:molybdate transport system ATP-binding protein
MARRVSLDADIQLQLSTFDLAVSLRVEDGETVAVLGPNGAGKTTLLSAIAGLVALDRGHVRLDDVTLDDPTQGIWVPTEGRHVGFVFQDHALFPHLSALDNIAFGLRAAGARRADAQRQARTWLERMGLGDHAAAKPRELSGGEAQRVALARALAITPRLLLLDEPLAALDATTRIEVRHDLRRHLDGFDGPRVLVTHDPLDAVALADRIVVVEAGRIAQTGSLDDLRAEPRSRYVADLVGINLYPGVLTGTRVQLAAEASLVVVNDEHRGGDVWAAIRPEAVAVHRQRPGGSPRNSWPATVTSVDLEGGRARVGLDGPVPIVAEVTAAAVRELVLVPDAAAWVSVKATEIDTYPR